MKKHYFLLSLSLCIAVYQNHYAQTVATQAADAINSVFSLLEKDRVPHGLLLDYALEFTDITAYNGTLTADNYMDIRSYTSLYHTLLMARITPGVTGLYPPDEFNSRRQDAMAQEKNSPAPALILSGLYYAYSRIKAQAPVQGAIALSGAKLVDVYTGNSWQNPYETLYAFALSPPQGKVEGLDVAVKLPAQTWYTNQAAQVESLEIDMGDGQGYRPLALDATANALYASAGDYVWTVKLSLSSGGVLYSHTRVRVSDPVSGELALRNPACGAVSQVPITASRSYLGIAGSATLQIAYGSGGCTLQKPLIVAEGFDTGLLGASGTLGDTDYFSFDRIILRSNSDALKDLIRNNTPDDYDIVYVNWDNGTDYIQRNAYVLEEVIHWVNQQKAAAGSVEPNVVWGQSMGGLVARYALRDMENLGQNHDTALYISQDVPHQGANVPIAHQYLVRHLIDQFIATPLGDVEIPVMDNAIDLETLKAILNAPAARQMLISYVSAGFSINNGMHQSWQAELNALGYPQQSRNIALSNGSHCAVPQAINPGEDLFRIKGKGSTKALADLGLSLISVFFPLSYVALAANFNEPALLLGLLPGSSELKFDFRGKALPETGSVTIYKGKITYKKTIAWLIPVTATLTNRSYNSPQDVPAYDYYPGGFIATPIEDIEALEENLLLSYNFELSVAPVFSFIPVVSALDVGQGGIPLTPDDYLNPYNAAAPPPAPREIPFDNFTTSYTNVIGMDNEFHLTLNSRSGDWLAGELNGLPQLFNCSFICANGGIAITGNATLCSSANYSVPAGGDATVSWSVSNTMAVNLAPAGNSVSLSAVNGYSVPVVLTATLSSAACNRVIEITKTIWVGVPALPASLSGPSVVSTGALVNYQGGMAPGATAYKWHLPYPYSTVNSYNYSGQNWQMYPTNHTSLQAFTGYGKYSGNVQFMGENACGCGGAKLLYVTHAGAGGGNGGGGAGGNNPIPKPEGGIPKFLSGEIADDDITSKETEDVLLYPNPAAKKITVQVSGLGSEKIIASRTIRSITVFDMLSRNAALSVLFTGAKTGVELDISQLSPGYYTVIIQTDTGAVARKFIVE